MTDQPAGPLVDAIGTVLDLHDNQHLTEVLIIGKAADFDTGDTALLIGRSDGLDWIAQLGLLHAARNVIDQAAAQDDD